MDEEGEILHDNDEKVYRIMSSKDGKNRKFLRGYNYSFKVINLFTNLHVLLLKCITKVI